MSPPQGVAAPRARRWAPVAAWAAVILILTSIPGVRPPDEFGYLDKLAHFSVYMILGWLAGRAMLEPRTPDRMLAVWGALGVFGALDELHQLWIPFRMASVADWSADLVGLATGLLTIHLTRAPRAHRTRTTP